MLWHSSASNSELDRIINTCLFLKLFPVFVPFFFAALHKKKANNFTLHKQFLFLISLRAQLAYSFFFLLPIHFCRAESQAIQRELAGLSERYSQKCLELNRAEQNNAEREREISRKERDMEHLKKENHVSYQQISSLLHQVWFRDVAWHF